ncbi:MAG: ATP-binding protein [Lachnospiraceae bacterium]|nr:ATP-binding protein [Lachnospiraceae bacterium]
MHIERTVEMQYLNNCYTKAGSQLIVLYGQKKIGKTQLLKNFTADKPYTYYKARSCSVREQQYLWAKELAKEGVRLENYPSFAQIFEALTRQKTQKKVIVIDEFQHIVKAGTSFMKELVEFMHNDWNNQDVMIILCSSAVGWIENSMVTKIGTIAYEITGFLKVKEFGYRQVTEYFSNYSVRECVETYAVLGGVPGLWACFDDTKTVKENICRQILNCRGLLVAEAEQFVAEQLRETSVYHTILVSIAIGRHKLNDLYAHTGFSRAKISVYLKNLMELEIVEKVFSYDTAGKENTLKGIYRIKNNFVNFYFRYIYPNASKLDLMTEEAFYDAYIAPTFATYVAQYFQGVCMEYMEEQNKADNLPLEYNKSGEWVGKVGTIDIVAQDEIGQTLIGLCNWEKENMTYDDVEWLYFCAKKAKLKPNYCYLFSAGGFDAKILDKAEADDTIFLIDMVALQEV